MKYKTDEIVYIPQLHIKRTIYIEDGLKYIMMDNSLYEINGYKKMVKDRYGMDISYESPNTMYKKEKSLCIHA